MPKTTHRVFIRIWRNSFSTDEILLREVEAASPMDALIETFGDDCVIQISTTDPEGNETEFDGALRPVKKKGQI